MNALYILYDNTCPVSLRHREWLARQEAIAPLHWLPHQAEEVPCRFPGIGLAHHIVTSENRIFFIILLFLFNSF